MPTTSQIKKAARPFIDSPNVEIKKLGELLHDLAVKVEDLERQVKNPRSKLRGI